MDRVKNYLHYVRGIDEDIIETFANENMIYESADYHNVVFVGFDKNGIPRHANKRGIGRGSIFKGNAESSMDEFAFHRIGQGKSLYLFEAPIDVLSFISMHKENWKNHSYAASCSVSDRVLFQCLKDYPYIEEVYLCLDSDEPGQTAADRISTKLFALGIESEILIPIHKDWNEDLLTNEENEKLGDENPSLIVSAKNRKRTMANCRCTMLKIIILPLLKKLYLTECRKKSHAETVRKKLSRSALRQSLVNIQASMLYPKSSTAETAERRTADAHGQKTERKRLYGDASADLITVKNTVKIHLPLKNPYFTMQLPRLLRKRLRWKKPMLLVSAGI